MVIVAHLKKLKPDDIEKKLPESMKFKEITVGKYKGAPVRGRFHAGRLLPGRSQAHRGGAAKTLKNVLERDKKPELIAGMELPSRRRISPRCSPWPPISRGFGGEGEQERKAGFSIPGVPNVPGLDTVGGLAGAVDGVEGFAASIKVASDISIQAAAVCKDKSTAEKTRKQAEEELKKAKSGLENLPPDLKDLQGHR